MKAAVLAGAIAATATAAGVSGTNDLLPLQSLSSEETSTLLKYWELDVAFGTRFEAFRVNGKTLSLVDPDECSKGEWLSRKWLKDDDEDAPLPIQWRQLCSEIAEVQQQGTYNSW